MPIELSVISALAAAAVSAAFKDAAAEDATKQAYERVVKLLKSRLSDNPPAEEALGDVQEEPDSPERQQRLQQAVFDIVVADDTFAVNLTQAVAEAKEKLDPAGHPSEDGNTAKLPGFQAPMLNGQQVRSSVASGLTANPVRGFPGLTVSAASPQTTAGTDFSIFVLVQNPFDVPITIHHVQTHIPVDLVDVNQWRIKVASLSDPVEAKDTPPPSPGPVSRFIRRRRLWREHPGVAIAVGTEITPEEARELFKSHVMIGRNLNVEAGGSASFAAVSFVLPQNPSSEDLDALMRRVIDYRRGTLPIRLQPGDSVVRQFVLKTRSRLFFRPLSHSFKNSD